MMPETACACSPVASATSASTAYCRPSDFAWPTSVRASIVLMPRPPSSTSAHMGTDSGTVIVVVLCRFFRRLSQMLMRLLRTRTE